jgi:hypothetical protein
MTQAVESLVVWGLAPPVGERSIAQVATVLYQHTLASQRRDVKPLLNTVWILV